MKEKTGFIMGVIMILLAALMVGIFYKRLPSELPFLYSLPWGEKQLIGRVWFSLSPVVCGLVFSLDMWLSYLVSKSDEVLGKVVVWFGVGIVAMYLVTFLKVLSLML